MNTRRWDAGSRHSKHTHYRPPHEQRAADNGFKRKWLATAIIVGIAVSGAATATTAVNLAEPDDIAVCHATGDSNNPFVLLVIPEDGFEHAHHRQHDFDYFVDPLTGSCGFDGSATEPVDGSTSDDVAEDDVTNTADDVEVDDAAPADEGTAPVDDDGTSDESAGSDGDVTDQDSAEASSDTDDASDDSSDTDTGDSDDDPAPSGTDLAVRQSAVQDEHQVTLTIVVENIGATNASDVSVFDELPDVRRPWMVSGADAGSCVLDGNSLSCWFSELDAGDSLSFTVHAYLDRLPCGQSMTSTAWVESAGDVEPRNDAASAGILARYC